MGLLVWIPHICGFMVLCCVADDALKFMSLYPFLGYQIPIIICQIPSIPSIHSAVIEVESSKMFCIGRFSVLLENVLKIDVLFYSVLCY